MPKAKPATLVRINSALAPLICQLASEAGMTESKMVNKLLQEALTARGLDVPELVRHGGDRKSPNWQDKL